MWHMISSIAPILTKIIFSLSFCTQTVRGLPLAPYSGPGTHTHPSPPIWAVWGVPIHFLLFGAEPWKSCAWSPLTKMARGFCFACLTFSVPQVGIALGTRLEQSNSKRLETTAGSCSGHRNWEGSEGQLSSEFLRTNVKSVIGCGRAHG